MATKTYLERIKTGESEGQFELDAQDARLSLLNDKLATQRALISAERKVELLKSAKPFNAANIITAIAEVNNLKAGQEELVKLEAELFPEIPPAPGQ